MFKSIAVMMMFGVFISSVLFGCGDANSKKETSTTDTTIVDTTKKVDTVAVDSIKIDTSVSK